MKIVVLAVGRIKPPYADDVQHYRKLLGGQARVEIVEVRDDEQVAKRIPERAFVSLLDSGGETMDSDAPIAVPAYSALMLDSSPLNAASVVSSNSVSRCV